MIYYEFLFIHRLPFTTNFMMDLIFIAAIIGFFLLALAYLASCESLKKGVNDK